MSIIRNVIFWFSKRVENQQDTNIVGLERLGLKDVSTNQIKCSLFIKILGHNNKIDWKAIGRETKNTVST